MKSLRIMLLLTIIALFFSACTPAGTPASPTPTAISVEDGTGAAFSLNSTAKRVVSLAPSNTELLFAVGAGDLVVGRDEFSDYPAEAANIPTVGGSMGKYDLEKIASLNPDLVLAGGINPPELIDSIKKLGLAVFFVGNPTTIDDMYANLRTVGQLTGHEADADTLIASLQQRVEAVEASLEGVTARPIVFYEVDATDPAKPFTTGPGTFHSELIRMAGGENVGDKLDTPWGQMSLEEIIVTNPDIIILGDSAYGETPEKVSQRPGWDGLQAVQNGQIYPFDDNLVSRPSHRLVDGLEALAKLIHPEQFK